MPGAARLSDKCSGHGCWPPRQNNQASDDVFVNERGQHRKDDQWAIHCCPGRGCHISVLLAGSPICFANEKQRGRLQDFVACGSVVATGSSDTRFGPETPGQGGGGEDGDLFYYQFFRAGYSRAGDRLFEKLPGTPPEGSGS